MQLAGRARPLGAPQRSQSNLAFSLPGSFIRARAACHVLRDPALPAFIRRRNRAKCGKCQDHGSFHESVILGVPHIRSLNCERSYALGRRLRDRRAGRARPPGAPNVLKTSSRSLCQKPSAGPPVRPYRVIAGRARPPGAPRLSLFSSHFRLSPFLFRLFFLPKLTPLAVPYGSPLEIAYFAFQKHAFSFGFSLP